MSFLWGGGFEIMFTIMFVLVFGIIIATAVRSVAEWGRNNQSPRLTVEARVVSRRSEVSHHHHQNGAMAGSHVSTVTTHYVTFQVESGDRMEFHVSGRAYGMLAEGDCGRLSFQGTRYLGFERS